MANLLSGWTTHFIDYLDINIEDVTFQLIAVILPTGARKVNAIITLDNKQSIIKIQNKDTICLARAIIVGLSVTNLDKLAELFKNKLTDDEVTEINHRRQVKTYINEGIISTNERKYIRQGGEKRLQGILA